MAIFDFGRQKPNEDQLDKDPFAEVGVAGAQISSGFVHDEFLPQLRGERGRRIFREMRDNDDTVASIIFAIEMLLRAVDWRVEAGDIDEEATEAQVTVDPNQSRSITTKEEAVEFLEGILFDDMSHTFDEFITNVLTMLTFGWQYTEIVFKRRNGEQPPDSDQHSSIFDDGMIGIHKLGDRSQETLDRWDVDEQGRVFGMWQEKPIGGGGLMYIPMAKALLFRPHAHKGSPEGRSVLRAAYRSWFFKKNIEEIEAIAIERELNGLPVLYIPNEILTGVSPEAVRARARYVQMARDIKFNEQGGAVLPSNPYYDVEGNPTTMKQVELQLVNAGGSRAIDTDKVIKRYQGNIARTILADFIVLGQGDRGSFALSKSKTDLFLRAANGWLENIASTLNRHLIPKIWQVNGLDSSIMPYISPGNIAPEDLGELGEYVKALTGAGIFLADPETTEHLRQVGGLPAGDDLANMEIPMEFDDGQEE